MREDQDYPWTESDRAEYEAYVEEIERDRDIEADLADMEVKAGEIAASDCYLRTLRQMNRLFDRLDEALAKPKAQQILRQIADDSGFSEVV